MNILKKAFAAIGIITLSFFVCVNASEEFSVKVTDVQKGTIRVHGNAEDALVPENTDVTVIVLEEGSDFLSSYKENTVAFGYGKTEKNAVYDVSFDFYNNITKKYDFYVLYDGIKKSVTFEYICIDDAAEVLRKISDGTANKTEIVPIAKKLETSIGIDMSVYKNEFDKNVFSNRIYTEKALLQSSESLSVIKRFLLLCDKAEKEIEILEKLGIATDISSRYSILKNNAELINLSFEKYNLLGVSEQNKVLSSFNGKSFNSFEEIKAHFDKAVTDAEKNYNTDSIGGTGGSGGGGGSGVKNGRTFVPSEVPKKFSIYDKFKDLNTVDWAAEEISYLYGKGIISGTGENKFEPNGLVTREQFAKMIVLSAGVYDEKAECDFTDVLKEEWYTPYVASAKKAGLVSGMGDGTFGTGLNISRQDMAVMIYNAFKNKGKVFENKKTDFLDFDEIADYAKESVSYLAAEGIVNGRGNGVFDPHANATRAEAAVLIYALCTK